MTATADHIPTIEAEDETPAPPAPEVFRIDSEERANWAVNKLLRYEEELARLDIQYQAMKKDIETRQASFKARFLLELEDWARANPPKKGKTIKLLKGNLSFRTVNGGWRMTDKEQALAWFKENKPELVKTTVKTTTTESVEAETAKALAAKLRADGGEVIPGMEFFDDTEVFDVKGQKATKGDE